MKPHHTLQMFISLVPEHFDFPTHGANLPIHIDHSSIATQFPDWPRVGQFLRNNRHPKPALESYFSPLPTSLQYGFAYAKEQNLS